MDINIYWSQTKIIQNFTLNLMRNDNENAFSPNKMSWIVHQLGNVIVHMTSCLWRHNIFYSSIKIDGSCHRDSLRYCEQFGGMFNKKSLSVKNPISTWYDHTYFPRSKSVLYFTVNFVTYFATTYAPALWLLHVLDVNFGGRALRMKTIWIYVPSFASYARYQKTSFIHTLIERDIAVLNLV